jgi:glycosyltransferase involved in cell wall biosynthesis
MWPWFGSRASRRLNRLLLTRQLTPILQALPSPPVAITTLPIVADLMDALPVRRWVYYCVDDFGQWPGLDHRTLQRMEEPLVQRADVTIAVSETLQDKLTRMGKEAHLLTHGIDVTFWQASAEAQSPLGELQGLQPPYIVFWGVVDRRMDVAYVKQLARDLTQGTIVVAGPLSDPDPELGRCDRVVQLGALPFERLPLLAQEAAVLIMPYADLPVTRAIQPLKLKEYLATGKPAVIRDLPAVRPWADCMDMVGSAEAFSQAVRLRMVEGVTEAQRRARQRLDGESWAEKARCFEKYALADPTEV